MHKLKFSKQLLAFLLLGSAYYIFITLTGFSLPCPWRTLTGYLCPGCGITTMCLALAHADFAAAQRANIFLFYTLPLLLAVILLKYYSPSNKVSYICNIFFYLYLASLLLFGIYRNL